MEEYESPIKSEDIIDTDDLNLREFSEVNQYYYECQEGKRESSGCAVLLSQHTQRQSKMNIPL